MHLEFSFARWRGQWSPVSEPLVGRRLSVRLVVVAFLLLPQHPLIAQSDRLEVGSFSIFVNGQRAGREQFSLRKAALPDGGAYELRAEGSLGDRRTAFRLETDSAGSPIRYSVEIRDGTAVAVRLGGQRVRGRFATLAKRDKGESAREYLLLPGILVVETDAYHQLSLVLRGRPAVGGGITTILTLSPLENTQRELRLELEALTDSVTIAGARRPARRWRLEERGGPIRIVWADTEGRILRVLIPARSMEAVRDDIPR